ncbi:putative extracellular solute-binding protein [Actinacidiphila reveromycinica]|uniref:Putative extracellular solute-binding protein n=1 Tax=Actinacidiphila reveromycinica TaxID=659352 RepID=A0A7U3UQP8_9ACTN|nr:glutamate ABC transporter substrate-binding protein [Streptomyces sp. SN-593]BBA96916.1 putative extracellular solute-binding protein [Streptomyces sp. SN-593]
MHALSSPSFPFRRRALAAGALATAALLATGCSSNGSSSSSVPGGGGAKAAVKSDSDTVANLIADEQPATGIKPGSTAAKIKASGTLRVGGTQTAALFSLLDPTTGKTEGFDAAMSQLLAKYIIGKPSTHLTNVTSQTREALLKAHQVDAVFATYTITPERAKQVAFAGPYYEDGLAIEVRKGTTGISSFADLNGKTVVTESGSTVPTAVKAAAPKTRIQLFDTNTECLQALSQHRADAYVLDQGILAGNAVTNKDVQVLPGTFTKEPYGIGVPLDQPDFKAFVDAWLTKVEADGTWAKVWKATVGTEVPGPVPTPPAVD